MPKGFSHKHASIAAVGGFSTMLKQLGTKADLKGGGSTPLNSSVLIVVIFYQLSQTSFKVFAN